MVSEPIVISEDSQAELPVEQEEEKPQEPDVSEESRPEAESTPADGM